MVVALLNKTWRFPKWQGKCSNSHAYKIFVSFVHRALNSNEIMSEVVQDLRA